MASGGSNCISLISRMDNSGLGYNNLDSSLTSSSAHVTSVDLTIGTYLGNSYIMGLIVNGQDLTSFTTF